MIYRITTTLLLSLFVLTLSVQPLAAQERSAGQTNRDYSTFSTSLDSMRRYVEGKINFLENQLTALTTRITDAETEISGLDTRVTDLETFRDTISQHCPTGYAIRGIAGSGAPACTPLNGNGGGSGVDNYSCPSGQVLSGVVNGIAQCTTVGDGGSGTLADLELTTGTLSSTGCGGRKGSGCRQGRRNIAEPGTFCLTYPEAYRSAYRYNSSACRYTQSTGQLTAGYYSSGHGDQGITTCRYYCFDNVNVSVTGATTSSSSGPSSSSGNGSGSGSGSNNWTDYLGLEQDEFNHR